MTEQLHTSCIRAHLYFCVIGKTFAHQRDEVFPMTEQKTATVFAAVFLFQIILQPSYVP